MRYGAQPLVFMGVVGHLFEEALSLRCVAQSVGRKPGDPTLAAGDGQGQGLFHIAGVVGLPRGATLVRWRGPLSSATNRVGTGGAAARLLLGLRFSARL